MERHVQNPRYYHYIMSKLHEGNTSLKVLYVIFLAELTHTNNMFADI